jgi:hypothetical protein
LVKHGYAVAFLEIINLLPIIIFSDGSGVFWGGLIRWGFLLEGGKQLVVAKNLLVLF